MQGQGEDSRSVKRQYTANVPLPSKLNVTDKTNLPQAWRKFRRAFDNYSIASRLDKEDDTFQCAVLLATIGEDAMDIFDGFDFPNEDDRKDLTRVLRAFENFCIGEAHEAYESYKFHTRHQQPEETFETYVTELRKLVKPCNFGSSDLDDRMIRDQIVVGVREEELRRKLLEDKKLTLSKSVDIGRAFETSRQQSHTIASSKESAEVNSLRKKTPPKKPANYPKQKPAKGEFKSNTKSKCSRCGRGQHNISQCPAKDAKCYGCGKKGHYSALCKSKGKEAVHEVQSEDEYVLGSIELITRRGQQICSVLQDKWHVDITTLGKSVTYKVDTGADVTVIPDRFFKRNSPLVQKTNKKLYGPGRSLLPVKGVVRATLSTTKKTTDQDLYVIQDLKEPLLGRPAIEALDLIQRVDSVDNTGGGIKQEFKDLFSGLGKMENPYKITLDKDARPFSVAVPRRLPLPLRGKVQEELKKMEEMDVIRPITEPTEWCAPIVVAPKNDDKIRLCVDYTKLNQWVKRENFPIPSTDHLLAQLSGATTFSKLDCNSGFFQVPLDEESQKITAFITPFGRYCFKRLPFGINSGPEVFQRRMSHIVADIPGIVCDIDDVLVSGRTPEEHDTRLRTVLQRMRDAGVTLNEKCVFGVEKIKFLGHIVSKEGITIDPEKVEAVTKMSKPENVPEVRRLLGMINHVGKFAPNMAEMTKPLRDLLKKDSCWMWGEPQDNAFEAIKKMLSTAPVLSHYSSKKETKISADASSFGLGGALLQKEGEDWKPVFYASRSLTDTESRYAQVEKESLAITWCCEKFADFLTGLAGFTIETDHKPLLALMKTKQIDELTPRLQRFRMRMMRFSYDIKYVAGKNLATADTLSRAPVSQPGEDEKARESESDLFVEAVMEGFPASDKKLQEIKEQQNLDPVCSQVKRFCKSQWPAKAKTDRDLKPYWTVRDDLTVEKGMLLFRDRLVIPPSLHQDILERLHAGHQGIVKCRALARDCVWWPGISGQIEQKVTNCPECERERKYHPEPLKPTQTPDYPWQRVGTDLFELKGHSYLLVVDYYSRWIEIAHLQQTTSKAVIEHLKSMFARHGIPESVRSDNGPQFSSSSFAQFADSYNFVHQKCSPLHPQSNGEAERAVNTIKMLLTKSQDGYMALLNYRTTPLQQGQTPAELLMGRKLRTRVPKDSKKFATKGKMHKEFKEADEKIKNRQKKDFDKRHNTKPMTAIENKQDVWIKTPADKKAKVVGRQGRSYQLQTETGNLRRNRHQLRSRDDSGPERRTTFPSTTSTLPLQNEHEQEMGENNCYDSGSEDEQIPQHHLTRTGRIVKPPIKLNL